MANGAAGAEVVTVSTSSPVASMAMIAFEFFTDPTNCMVVEFVGRGAACVTLLHVAIARRPVEFDHINEWAGSQRDYIFVHIVRGGDSLRNQREQRRKNCDVSSVRVVDIAFANRIGAEAVFIKSCGDNAGNDERGNRAGCLVKDPQALL